MPKVSRRPSRRSMEATQLSSSAATEWVGHSGFFCASSGFGDAAYHRVRLRQEWPYRLYEYFGAGRPESLAASDGRNPRRLIESPHAGVRIQTRRVTHWRNGNMVLRWMASAFLRTESPFNKIMGYRDLWTLEAILNPAQHVSAEAAA